MIIDSRRVRPGGPAETNVNEDGSINVGILVRAYRRKRGLTQQQLAGLSTISVRAIRDIESGRVSAPRLQTIRLVSKAMRLDRVSAELLEAAVGQPDDVAAIAPQAPPMLPLHLAASKLTGRENEMGILKRHITERRARLVTITGVPGVGKTHLAFELARSIEASSGVRSGWLSSGAFDPMPLSESVSPELGVPADDGTTSGPGATGGGSAVLVVDDMPATSKQRTSLLRLLAARPALTVVATSPEPTELPGEFLLPLSPLPVPTTTDAAALESNPAMSLLLHAIEQVRPTLELTPSSAAALVDLCRGLDGLPGSLLRIAPSCALFPISELAERVRSYPLYCPLGGEDLNKQMRTSINAAFCQANRTDQSAIPPLGRLTGAWSVDEAAETIGIPRDTIAAAVEGLMRRGMLRTSAEGPVPRFEMLNVVRYFLR
ncbi:helix-turn-helix domain-containing protein [Micromonospora sp. NPDC002296]|uniref:helix-turn-helix domain-containing protein n=1 Tax=Micromonospora sp. NPDC002296 TaxID=3154271 RepID=UPI00332ABF9C